MPGMGGNRLRRRRRDERPTSIDLLLDDPETIRVANEAFALAERPDLAAWPFVASVGAETIALRWAGGTSIPEPTAPWRAGYDARVWVADRSDLAESDAVDTSGRGGTAVLVGWFEETLVCVNASRAPGPIAVDGDDEAAELLRELIARQTRVQPRTPADGPGAWWPMEARGNVIQLIGLAVARTFSAEESHQAVELVRLAAALDLVRQNELDAAGAGTRPRLAPGETETRPEDALELWLDQVKAAAAQVAVGAYQRALTAEAPMDAVDDVVAGNDTADVDVADAAEVVDAAPLPKPGPVAPLAPAAPFATDFAFSASSRPGSRSEVGPRYPLQPEPPQVMSASSAADTLASAAPPVTASAPVPAPAAEPAPAPEPVPSSGPSPAPVDDDLDDWAAGFAVSSAEQTSQR